MKNPLYPVVYGPVISWRLGISLGINPVPALNKICNFNCVYCELGDSEICNERKEFIRSDVLSVALEDVKKYPAVDHITIAGSGEPTLAANLHEIITVIRSLNRAPIALLTNGSLLNDSKVRESLALVDKVIVKLDADNADSFQRINKPDPNIRYQTIIKNMALFRQTFHKVFCIQIMLCQKNVKEISEIAGMVPTIVPDEIQICSPTRGGRSEPIPVEMFKKVVSNAFRGFTNVRTQYDA